jgi:predicted Na+-dependent transporter
MLVVLLVPTVLGMILRKVNPNIGATIELIGSMMGIFVILFLIVTWVPRNYQMLLDTPLLRLFRHHRDRPDGHAFGYWVARGLGQDTNRARTISLETGIQNGPLAVLVITLTFTGASSRRCC